MPEEPSVSAVAHVIQLSVAPVFLLSAIGSMLVVMTNRLSRIIDRARYLQSTMAVNKANAERIQAQIVEQSHRAKLISRAITFCTITALLICAVVVTLFMAAFVEFDASAVVAILFISAMAAFFVGLLYFLREILVATAGLRLGRHLDFQ